MSQRGREGPSHIPSQRHSVETVEELATSCRSHPDVWHDFGITPMPPRRLATWSAAWREGGAGQASEVWFCRRLGAAGPFPLGEGVHNGFKGGGAK